MVYLISANTGQILGTATASSSADAMSKIVDWTGKVLAEAGSGESTVANAVIDLPALRAARQRIGMGNLLSRQPFAAYEQTYEQTDWAVPNAMAGGGMLNQKQAIARQRAVIDRLIADGVLR